MISRLKRSPLRSVGGEQKQPIYRLFLFVLLTYTLIFCTILSRFINKNTMGTRKKERTKWKAERKAQIRKVSAQRLKKALKLSSSTVTTPTNPAKEEKKMEEKQAA